MNKEIKIALILKKGDLCGQVILSATQKEQLLNALNTICNGEVSVLENNEIDLI